MSSVPDFQSILLWTTHGVRVFSTGKKGVASASEWLSLSDPLPNQARELLQGNSVLVLVGDAATGHVQLALPNKKDELDDAHVGEILVKDYEIDLSAYEFASQKFTLSREQVQMSVSGIEKVVFQKILDWLAAFTPRKVWMMPVGWFLSPLKSVEPVLLAVAEDADHISVAHHYLGVDDAREISLSDLEAYVTARKEERKETHLLYLQAPTNLQTKIAKAVGDVMAIHPLIEKAGSDIWLDVINAVFDKGTDVLGELLHFDIDDSLLPAVANEPSEVLIEKPEKPGGDEEKSPEEVVASDLPKPIPPEHAVARVEVVEEIEEESESVEEVNEPVKEEKPEKGDSKKEAPEETPKVEPSAPEVVEIASEPEPVSSVEPGANEKAKAIFAELKAAKVSSNNDERYVEMPKKSSTGRFILIAVLAALVTVVIAGAIFWSQQIPKKQQPMLGPSPTPEATPAPTPAPAATESAQVDDGVKKDTKILVLNAEGTPGLANKAKQKLAASGWKNVQTGNATGTYKDAVFIFAEDDALIKQMETATGATLTRIPTLQEKSGQGYDIVLILAEKIDW